MPRLDLLDKVGEVTQVSPPGQVFLGGLGEPFLRVVADGRQQVVRDLAAAWSTRTSDLSASLVSRSST